MFRFLPALLAFCLLGARSPGPKPPPISHTLLLNRMHGPWDPADLYNLRLLVDVNREDGGAIYHYSGREERPYAVNRFQVISPDRYKDLTTGYTYALRFATVGTGKNRRLYMTVRLVGTGDDGRVRRFVRAALPDAKKSRPTPG